jgi:hypothetical protein
VPDAISLADGVIGMLTIQDMWVGVENDSGSNGLRYAVNPYIVHRDIVGLIGVDYFP